MRFCMLSRLGIGPAEPAELPHLWRPSEIRGFDGLAKIGDTFLGFFGDPYNKDCSIYWGLYWRTLILGNYHMLGCFFKDANG